MDTLYYDNNDRVLWILKENGEKYPIYTLANLNGENTRLTDEGYLQVYNGHTSSWEYVTDDLGLKVSLKGPKGDAGKDGNPGKDGADAVSYHLELSNDMDQVYVASLSTNTVQFAQSLKTALSLYANGDIQPLSGWSVNLQTDGWPSTIITKFTQNNEIIVTCPVGTVIPMDTLTCKIIASNGDTHISKDFKLKKMCGTMDYDLYIPYGYFKIYSTGRISPTELPVQVKRKELGTPQTNVTVLKPNELPSGYSLTYKWSGEVEQSVPQSGMIPAKSALTDEDSLMVYLKHNNATIDFASVEVVKSGQDGSSSKLIELSNDLDQIFVGADGKLVAGQAYEIYASLFEGTTQEDLDAQNVIVESDHPDLFSIQVENPTSGNMLDVVITITPNESQSEAFTDGNYKFLISTGGSKKTFNLMQLHGTMDYDLVITPGFIKVLKNEDDTFRAFEPESFTVTLSAKEVGVKDAVRTELTSLPDSYFLTWKIDQEYQDAQSLVLGQPYNLPVFNTGELPTKITVELNRMVVDSVSGQQVPQVIDRSEVALYSDGKKGDKGDPGASSYYLDFVNDYDQIYKYNGVLFDGQSYTTDVSVFRGTQQVQLTEQMNLTLIEDENDPVFGLVSITKSDDNSHFTIQILFQDSEGRHLDETAKQLTYKFGLQFTDQYGDFVNIYHNTKIAVLNSAHNYDIYANRYQIAKDGGGSLYDTDSLNFEIRHTDLSQDGNTFTKLITAEQLQEQGLKLQYLIDNETDPIEINTGNLSISSDVLATVQSRLWVELWEGATLRDQEQIRVVKDGANAQILYIDLSNDMDQVYLNSANQVIKDTIVTSDIFVYDGVTQLGNAILSVERADHTEEFEEVLRVVDNTLEIKYKQGATINQTHLSYIITASINGVIVTKKFKVLVLVGNTSYDLRLSSTVLKLDQYGAFSPDLIRVYVDKSQLSVNQETTTGIDWTNENLSVYYTINNEGSFPYYLTPSSIGNQTCADIAISASMFGEAVQPSLQVYLCMQDQTPLDMASIEVIKDGKDGKDGKNGKDGVNASGYMFDFSNDSDQLYIDASGNLYSGQVIETDIKGLKGTTELEVPIGFQITDITLDDSSQTFMEASGIFEEDQEQNCYHVQFVPKQGASVPAGTQVVTYTITASFDGITELSKRYKINIFKSSVDYDLHVSNSIIKLDPNTNTVTPTSVTTTVKKRELGTNKGQGAELSYNSFSSENLAVKYAEINTSNLNTQLSYKQNNSNWKSYTGSIDTTNFTSTNKCLVIALFNSTNADSVPLDYVVVDIVSDGRTGDRGPEGPEGPKGADNVTLQSKNGNSHIFYLNTAGKALQSNQSAVFQFEQTKGGVVQTFSGNLQCSPSTSGSITPSVDNTNKKVTFSIQTTTTYTPGQYVFSVSDGIRSVSITITLATGTTIYDLVPSPAYVHQNLEAGTYDEVVITVYSECSGGGYFEETELAPSQFTIKYAVDGNGDSIPLGTYKDYTVDGETKSRYYFTPDSEKQVTLYCYSNSPAVMQDFSILPVIKDGAPGTLEAAAIILKDESNEEVGGLSGKALIEIDGESVLDTAFVWGGGTHQAAVTDPRSLPVVITKQGTNSKLGPLVVESEATVRMLGKEKLSRLTGSITPTTNCNYLLLDSTDATISLGTATQRYTQTVNPSVPVTEGGDTPSVVAETEEEDTSWNYGTPALFMSATDTIDLAEAVSSSVTQTLTTSKTYSAGTIKPSSFSFGSTTLGGTNAWASSQTQLTFTITVSNLPDVRCKNGARWEEAYIDVLVDGVSKQNISFASTSFQSASYNSDTKKRTHTVSKTLTLPQVSGSTIEIKLVLGTWRRKGTTDEAGYWIGGDWMKNNSALTISCDKSSITWTQQSDAPAAGNPITKLVKNGVMITNGRSWFTAFFSGTKLRVIANGLPYSGSVKGELYQENGYIKIKT